MQPREEGVRQRRSAVHPSAARAARSSLRASRRWLRLVACTPGRRARLRDTRVQLGAAVAYYLPDEVAPAFLADSLIAIDTLPHSASNAHLVFMIMLSRYLGFGPQFVNEILGGRVTDQQTEKIMMQLLRAGFDSDIVISNDQRRTILDLLIRFYSEHIENIGEFKSVQILRDILA